MFEDKEWLQRGWQKWCSEWASKALFLQHYELDWLKASWEIHAWCIIRCTTLSRVCRNRAMMRGQSNCEEGANCGDTGLEQRIWMNRYKGKIHPKNQTKEAWRYIISGRLNVKEVKGSWQAPGSTTLSGALVQRWYCAEGEREHFKLWGIVLDQHIAGIRNARLFCFYLLI